MALAVYCCSVAFRHPHLKTTPRTNPKTKEVIKIFGKTPRSFFWLEWVSTKYLYSAMNGLKKRKKESGRLERSYLKYFLSFNIDGLFSDRTSQRSKRATQRV